MLLNRNGPRPDAVTHKRENIKKEEIRERGGLSLSVCVCVCAVDAIV